MNERKLPAALSGVAACVLLGAFLIGVPACLVRLVGNPLPAALPAWSSVTAAVESGVLPPGIAIRVVAVVVWIWWSQVAISCAAEVAAACRGRTARRMPLGAVGVQPIVAWLVTIAVTAAGTLGLVSQPALAATPSFAGVSVPVPTGQPAPGTAGQIAEIPGAGVATGSAPSGSALPGAPSGAATASSPPAPILAPPPVGSTVASAVPAPAALPDASAPILAPAEPVAAPAVRSVALPVPTTGPGARDRSPAAVPSPDVPATAGARIPAGGMTHDNPPASVASREPDRWAPPDTVTALAGSAAPEAVPVAEWATAEIRVSGWVVVKPGDSLWRLAEQHLGDALAWRDIYDLNAGPLPGGGTLRDPNLIHPGWRLRLPTAAAGPSSHVAAGVPDPAPAPADPARQGPG